MSETYIPLSQINTYVFCPRRFYYESIEGHQVVNAHVEEGKIKHEHVHTAVTDRKKGEKTISRRQYLASDTLGISGYTDLVEEKEGVPYPVEFKKAGIGNWLNDQVQLCLQGLLLEEKTGISIPHGYIFYIGSKRRRKVPFDKELRQTTRQYIAEARALLDSRKIPKPVHDNRCNGCSVRPICLPDEVAYLHELDERPKRIKPALGIDNVLYVDEPGCAIKKTGERILVAKENEIIRDIPIIHLGQVVISGNVNLTTPAMQTLLHEGIPVVFLSGYGRYHGALTPQVSRNSLLRSAQHKVTNSPDACLDLSKAFVRGKVANMRTMLQRRKWQSEDSTDSVLEPLLANIKAMQAMEKRIDKATEFSELLGIEGNASAAYFGAFNFMLKSEMGFDFQRRSRRPPADATNALLSFAYSLLTADLMSAIQTVGLDPYIGFFHQLKYGKPCLALDLMEEFRPIIADSVVITLINNRRIKIDDFTQSHGGWYLKEHRRKVFYAAYETRKNETITHPLFKYKLTFRRAIELQVRLLAKCLTGEIDQYTPLMIR
ncbi:CRISPR-associated endonuclease Cas1 [Candidatus Poribacteria bacterium]|nr:CRISPR-associated endonuclease Cas1 [Candidatus Poribacteria bacterium]MYB01692.1 CRISPR-associated endonuclease Cas1 [Candidatus Poribacteria bacterium]